ncbi:MAG: di-heme oxidoredictase family protein [Pseudomonadota bacterium]
MNSSNWRQHMMLGLLAAGLTLAGLALSDGPRASGEGATQQAAEDTPWAERAVRRDPALATVRGALSAGDLKRLVAYGEMLFAAKFTTADGAGRPNATQAIIPTKRRRPSQQMFARLSGGDAASCAACHNDPVMGGAGDFSANAFVSEGFAQADFDTTDPQFSNERNSNHLFGAGLVELLAREMTADLQALRTRALREARTSSQPVTVKLETKGVAFGELVAKPDGVVDLDRIDGVDEDLVIRPFSQKGVIVSLRQFTINALNHHHGMQAEERFGARWTGEADFDGDGRTREVTTGDVTALVAWQATLAVPPTLKPTDARWRTAAASGSKTFDAIGCADCHRRALPLRSTVFRDPGPYDSAGTLRDGESPDGVAFDLAQLPSVNALPRNADGHILVPLFSDLKRHQMVDRTVDRLGNELIAQRFVAPSVFQTSELWGIASTAPFGHRGDITTLDEVIRAHGGAARTSRDRYIGLGDADRSSVIAFLKTLVLPK